MKRGSITVFLSLLLAVVLTFSMTLLESVRLSGLKFTADEAADAAAESVFAGYDRALLEDYGLLFYDGGMGQGLVQYEEIEAEFETYFKDNTHAGLKLLGGSFYPVKAADCEMTELISATDYNGEIFIRSVLDYYEFAGAAALLSSIQADIETSEQGDRQWSSLLRGEELPSSEELFGETDETEEGDGGEESGKKKYSLIDRWKYEKKIKDSPIGARKKSEKKGWMNLVIPSGRTISGKKTNQLNFPSVSGRDDRELEDGNVWTDGTEKIIFNEYLLEYFSDFTDGDSPGLSYEVEYILFGNKSDSENLKSTLKRLLWLREGMNLLYILSSPTKMNDAEQMATLLVGWTEIEVLVPIAQAAIIGAWSYAESLADLKILLSGGKVPMTKTARSWNLDLEGVVDFLRGNIEISEKKEKGLTYQGYLRLFLFLTDENELSYRAMDMIQLNRQQSDKNFLMMSEIYAMEFRTELKARPLLFRLPVFYRTSGKWGAEYEWTLYNTKTY